MLIVGEEQGAQVYLDSIVSLLCHLVDIWVSQTLVSRCRGRYEDQTVRILARNSPGIATVASRFLFITFVELPIVSEFIAPPICRGSLWNERGMNVTYTYASVYDNSSNQSGRVF